MHEPPRSPRISHLSWGRLEVDDGRGGEVRYKDAKLFPGVLRGRSPVAGTGPRP